MKTLYKIGKGSENDIVIYGEDCPDLHAEIKYERAYWVLSNLVEEKPILLNEAAIRTPRNLSKNDKIKLCSQTIYWSNYLYEGESQELSAKDIISFNGRISRANFRALNVLAFGLAICIFFLPGLLVATWEYINRRRFRTVEFDSVSTIQEIAPLVYVLGFGILGVILLLLGIKRIRDTGNPIWKLIVPFYNLKWLYFDQSKK